MTVKEVIAKGEALELERDIALEAAKQLTPATPEFDDAYGRYLSAKAAIAKIPEEVAGAKLAENADAINATKVTVGEAIAQLLTGLKVAELLGVPVTGISYRVDAEGKTTIVYNPVTKLAPTGKRQVKGTGHNMIVSPDGSKMSLTKFVQANATEAELATPEYKYPHTRVDSKPKFDKFCEEHNLTGYTYETPKTEAEAS